MSQSRKEADILTTNDVAKTNTESDTLSKEEIKSYDRSESELNMSNSL